MGVGAGLYMYVVVVQKFTFAILSPDEFLYLFAFVHRLHLYVTNLALWLQETNKTYLLTYLTLLQGL